MPLVFAAILIALAVILWSFGWRWEHTVKRPPLNSFPLVSILIPAYKSAATIRQTLLSVSALAYPHKEIIVANDTDDATPAICKEFGARCIQSSQRMGKARSLNAAVKHARGDILFFVDSDTEVAPDTLNKLLPWFSNPRVGAVAPQYVINHTTTLLTKLISLEHSILSTFFKIHMFFGSLITFRGCGIAIRRSSFEAAGGWPETLIEDVEFSSHLVGQNQIIQYEPEAVVKTREPETMAELSRQRFRWGKGSLFSFINNRHSLWKKPQFLLYFYPYIIISFAILAFLSYQSAVVTLPVISLFLLYAFSIKEFSILILSLLAIIFSTTAAAVVTGTVTHLAVLAFPESVRKHNPFLLIPFLFYFVPAVLFAYLKGMKSGIADLRHHHHQLNLNDW